MGDVVRGRSFGDHAWSSSKVAGMSWTADTRNARGGAERKIQSCRFPPKAAGGSPAAGTSSRVTNAPTDAYPLLLGLEFRHAARGRHHGVSSSAP